MSSFIALSSKNSIYIGEASPTNKKLSFRLGLEPKVRNGTQVMETGAEHHQAQVVRKFKVPSITGDRVFTVNCSDTVMVWAKHGNPELSELLTAIREANRLDVNIPVVVVTA